MRATGRTSPGAWLDPRQGQVHIGQPRWLRDDFAFRDLPERKPELEELLQPAVRSESESDFAIYQDRLNETGEPRECDRLARPVAGAADFARRAGSSRRRVDVDHQVRVEHVEQAVHVTRSQRGKEGVGNLSLSREIPP